VDDMIELQPFEGASNRTSVMILQKDRETTYPISYTYWKKVAKGSIGFDSSLEEAMAKVQWKNFVAMPVNVKDKTSAWLTGRPKALRAIKKVLGKSDYQAHEGVNSGGANGVYWLEIWEKTPDGLVMVTNITEGQKRDIPEVPLTALEPDLIYPLLRGRDVKRWQAKPSAWILMAQDPEKRRGMDEKEMQLNYPKTWSYLKQFDKELRSRAAYKRYFSKDDPFYSMFDVSDFTFARYKVVWTRLAKIEAAVVNTLDGKCILPQETVTLVECDSSKEAHYMSALINCAIFQYIAMSYSQAGGKSMGSMHILENIRIPKFDPKSPLHLKLAELSEKAHSLAAISEDKALREVEQEIDRLSGELWGLSEDELAEIKKSLDEIS